MSAEGEHFLFDRCPRTLNRKRLRSFRSVLQEELTGGVPFTCLLAGDARLRRLNRQFLGHDEPTDVLSFPGESPLTLGEIAISVDRAREQAAEFGHSIEEEIEILMLHGALHLMGMDHEKDRGKMARAEADWRGRLGLPGTLIGRVRK